MTIATTDPAAAVRQRYRDESVPAPGDWNDVLAVLHAHRSVRKYVRDDVSDDKIRTLVSAAQSAATSSNLQVWSVIAVRDRGRRERLAALANQQAHIVAAPVLLVWTADFARLRQLAATHGTGLAGADYLESSYVGFIDAALAAQNAVVAAESLGLGTVFIGALRNKPEAVAAELELPPHVFAVFGLVVGVPDPAESAQVKPRLPQSAVLHHETYDLAAQPDAVVAYERRIADYYDAQGLAHSWTARVLERLGSAGSLSGRHRLRDSLVALGFPLH